MSFLQSLKEKLLFFDGAMGTLLQAKGLKAGELPETWNVLHPEEIRAVHRSYLEAGCRIIKANTFGINSFKMKDTPYSVEELVKAGMSLARQEAENFDAFTALDIGSLGKLLQPLGTLSFDDAYEAFAEVVRAGKDQADLILIETMNEPYEMKAALLAAKENADLPVVVTMIIDEKGRLLTGGEIPAAVAMLEGLGADAIGLNCGLGPDQMLTFMPELTACCSKPIVINPNAGMPILQDGRTVFPVGPEEFAKAELKLLEAGAHCLGGCCGTTPEHLRQTVLLCEDKKRQPVTEKDITVVSSYGAYQVLGEQPIIIGERINPTGKAKLKKALREQNYTYVMEEALRQEEAGAHVLDVNVGLPEIDEAAVLQTVTEQLQQITKLPLQLDTADTAAMERALRHYNGKALINSVNGKQESMEAIFPLVKKYGGVVVGLTLDEEGIPETAEGRVKIAEKIIKTAETYGISRKDIIIDTLTMTISTGPQNARITLDALERVHKELEACTVLGVSNISFGLPNRELVSSSFFTLALERGLSAGIINPGSALMRRAYDVFLTLQGYDENCQGYIEKYSAVEVKTSTVEVAPKASGPKASAVGNENFSPLMDAIVKGLSDAAFHHTVEELKEKSALEVIDGELIPALDFVGKAFEKGTLFLPQLLMSAQAAQSAFQAIKDSLKGEPQESKGTIVLATVKGDIHDIGKNIVKVLLENYGYTVLDLGKDVSPESIVEVVMEQHVKLVGLSALMTTTVVNMAETVRQLRKAAPWCKIIVGGAVLTQIYADEMGADYYSKDAMNTVRYAEELFGAE